MTVRPEDQDWIYQPEIEIAAAAPVIVARDMTVGVVDPDPDIASADLTYRKRRELATGHGVSTDWELADGCVDRATRVWTTVIPDTIVPIVSPAGEGVPLLDMDALAEANGEALTALLTPLADAYETWISGARGRTRRRSPTRCARSAATISRSRPMRWAACARECRSSAPIRWRNRHSTSPTVPWHFNSGTASRFAPGGGVCPSPKHRLHIGGPSRWASSSSASQVLPSRITTIESLADLLWFPTGGGKTEAYFGLTAFTLAHRRLRPDLGGLESGAGTSVLMRYTLRLLTIQQFQRALALLCACETLRARRREDLGDRALHDRALGRTGGDPQQLRRLQGCGRHELRAGKQVYEGSPYQILYCPWCGEDLTPNQYTCDDDLERTLVHCATRRMRLRTDAFAARSASAHGRRGDLPPSTVASAGDGRQVCADAAERKDPVAVWARGSASAPGTDTSTGAEKHRSCTQGDEGVSSRHREVRAAGSPRPTSSSRTSCI